MARGQEQGDSPLGGNLLSSAHRRADTVQVATLKSELVAPGDVPDAPLLGYWRAKGLYTRGPCGLSWVQTTWMLGGSPLAMLLNLWVLPALPLPQRTRRRIEVSSWALLAVLVVLMISAPFALPELGISASAGSWLLILVAPGVAGFALYAAFGSALVDAYRTLRFWGGTERFPLVFLPVPLLVGLAVDTVVFWPLIAIGEGVRSMA